MEQGDRNGNSAKENGGAPLANPGPANGNGADSRNSSSAVTVVCGEGDGGAVPGVLSKGPVFPINAEERNKEGANGQAEETGRNLDEHVSSPMPKTDPMYYDIYPIHFHYIYHVEVGRNLTTGLSKGELEFKVRQVIERNFETIPNVEGRELKDLFPELVNVVTSLKIFKERNVQSRFAEYLLDNETPPGTPAGSSLNSSRQRLNSDSKGKPLRGSSTPPNKPVTKVPKSEKSCAKGVIETQANRYFRYHIFDLFREDGEADQIMQDQMDYEDEHIDPTVHSNHYVVPRDEWLGLWESLYFEDDTKEKLFQYISSALLFSVKEVDTTFVAFNKVIMLHGPPGCGKTSLCKAVAQRCSIRFAHRYEGVQFLEVNSHSLFSKWFSESGKLVDRMFDKIFEMVHEQKHLVMLLIDEVESLAQCRQAAIHGFEPTDSIRAVNALLVNIDKLSQYPNVVVMATSNIVGGIDLAFVDRADLKMYLGPPPTEVVFGVLASSLNELLNSGIIAAIPGGFVFPTSMRDGGVKNVSDDPNSSRILKLIKIAKMAVGFSGRALRKICFLTHARFFHSVGIDLDTYLHALRVTIQAEMTENDRVNKQRNILPAANRIAGTPQRT